MNQARLSVCNALYFPLETSFSLCQIIHPLAHDRSINSFVLCITINTLGVTLPTESTYIVIFNIVILILYIFVLTNIKFSVLDPVHG